MGKQGAEDDSGHYCEACQKQHGSAIWHYWHYRHSSKGTREFICKRGYKALKPMEQARWLSLNGE